MDRPRILREPSFWTLVESFYRAFIDYQTIFENYESRVLAHAHEEGVDRRYLRLDAEKVSKLLDFDALNDLRDGHLFQFKHCSHKIFRLVNIRWRDLIDRYANEIFHNISMLKELQYMVTTFVPLYDDERDAEARESLLAEVHEEFPNLVHRLNGLFEAAIKQIEALMKQDKYRETKVFIRSLYIYGDDLFSEMDCYPDGLEDVYDLIYPCGSVEAYLKVAFSFKESGFFEHARSALLLAVKSFERLESELSGKPEKRESLRRLMVDLEELRKELDEKALDVKPKEALGLTA